MKLEHNPLHSGKVFSCDEQENLRIENEILQLKLKNEFGCESTEHADIPPEVENEFLKNVLAFEQAYANVKQVKLYDLLDRPLYTPSGELTDEAIEGAFQELTALLTQKNVVVNFRGSYSNRTKYAFITEELFEHETDNIQVPGLIKHFSYEEFHQDHKADIEDRAIEFLSGWFEKSIQEYNWELGDPLILADGRILSKDEVLQKMQFIFDAYTEFTDSAYAFYNISFELREEDNTGMGYAEGVLKYKAVSENGEQTIFKGPFKLYLSLHHKWWSIFYFVLPGFQW